MNPALWVLGAELVPFAPVDEARPGVAQAAPFTAWLGVDRGRLMLTGALGAHISRTTVSSEAGEASSMEGALRPMFGARWYLDDPGIGGPTGFLTGDVGGVIPLAHERSDAFSEAEQEAWDAESASLRARIGGVEARLGVGAELRTEGGLSLGLVGRLGVLRGWETEGEVHSASWTLRSHAALILGLAL